MRKFLTYIILFFFSNHAEAQTAKQYIEAGWQQLAIDNDTTAILYFSKANSIATQQHDIENKAHALLYLGMASYGSSLTNGIYFTSNATKEYKKLEHSKPEIARIGYYRCVQLMSTIKAREGKLNESIALSHEALSGISNTKDTSGTLGIIYSSLGQVYSKINRLDSSYYYHQLALTDRINRKDMVYLASSYSKMAELELARNQLERSKKYYELAYQIADSTNNRQAKVSALLGRSKWYLYMHQPNQADSLLQKAEQIALGLSDKTFLTNTLIAQKNLYKQQGNYYLSLQKEERINLLKDSALNWEKERITKSLEVQYDVAEKERKMTLIQHERRLTQKANYLLWAALLLLLIIGIGCISFLRKINKKDKQLLIIKEDLAQAKEVQRRQHEQKLNNDIDFKESQLSAMTVQMFQKSELLTELKDKLGEQDGAITKLINKGLGHEKEWEDFDKSFESINKNFYQRLKEKFPEISPNELKICALIKMNLSIKEMAGILNISPDSVKTARYRLRKKLQLNTEDNLTDFILSL